MLTNKRLFISGATSGIGKSCVMLAAEQGANIVFTGRNIESGENLENYLKTKFTGFFKFISIDFHDEQNKIPEIFSYIADNMKGIDVAINNAGIAGDIASFQETTESNFDKVISVNLKSLWLCMKYQVDLMLNSERGNIINIASTSGIVGNGMGFSSYAVSKHAVIGLTKSVALELAKKNIRVNAICPGFVETKMVDEICHNDRRMRRRIEASAPLGRLGTPDEIANLAVSMATDGYTFMTGSVVVIDGGLTAY